MRTIGIRENANVAEDFSAIPLSVTVIMLTINYLWKESIKCRI